jgi:hypothetical protein
MKTQLTTVDLARQTNRACDRMLNSILRTLTVAVALLIFGFSSSMVLADHMGNHARYNDQSVTECSSDSGVLSATDAAPVGQGGTHPVLPPFNAGPH